MKTQSVCLLFAFLVSTVTALAQVDKASVTGTLTDPSGATVSGANVTITYPSTGLSRAESTNNSGAFLIVGLPVGHAQLAVVKPGFRPVHTELDLNVGETKTLNFK